MLNLSDLFIYKGGLFRVNLSALTHIMQKENLNNTNTIKEKKNYKKAPLMPIHLRVFTAVLLGQIACGFSLGISSFVDYLVETLHCLLLRDTETHGWNYTFKCKGFIIAHKTKSIQMVLV